MNSEERAVKDGLKQVLNEMNKQAKVTDLNRGYIAGYRQGKEWILMLALFITFIVSAIVVTATLITVGEVDGRSEAQNRYHQQQQKVMIDQMALMKVELQSEIEKLENEVIKK
jgi:hypothetical protein